MDAISLKSISPPINVADIGDMDFELSNKPMLEEAKFLEKNQPHSYLDDLLNLPRLHWQETQTLLRQYRDNPGNDALWDKIIEGNLHIVATTVRTMAKKITVLDIDDLLYEGYKGLCAAVSKFDNIGGSDFGGYAGYWIMQFVYRYIANNKSVVRIPVQAQVKLAQGKIHRIDIAEDESNTDNSTSVKKYILTEGVDPFLCHVVEKDGSYRTLWQAIAENLGCWDISYVDRLKQRFKVQQYWGKLSDIEKKIVVLRNFARGSQKYTLEFLSSKLGYTRERVRQIEQEAYRKLKTAVRRTGYYSVNEFYGVDSECSAELPEIFTYSPAKLHNLTELMFTCSATSNIEKCAIKSSNLKEQELIFISQINYTFFAYGICIPIASKKSFLSQLNGNLTLGVPYSINIIYRGGVYPAKVIVPRTSAVYNNVTLRWGTRNPILSVLTQQFSECFNNLKTNRAWNKGYYSFALYSTEKQDNFVLQVMDNTSGNDLINKNESNYSSPPHCAKSSLTKDLIRVLLEEFSTGFVFNISTIKLLENKLGRDCSETEQRELKRIMFKRSDDVYLLPEMVADDETVADMTARIKEYFAEYGCFSLSVLFDEFGYVLKNLTNPDSDFRLFLLKTILPDDGKIFGRLQRQICIPGNISEEEVTQTLAERIREMLQGYGDAVFIEDLDNELPYLNKPALEMILQEHIADAIEIKVDGLSYWKLVEFFCLPDDFAEYLQLTVSSMEEAQTAPSLQTLSEAMEQQYGEGFREIYAVDDDDVFKQIIKVCIADDQYSWNRNVFAKQNAGQELNVADEFLQTQQGIFHESEFFDYASTHRGLTNTGMLILTFLRNKCIRLDQTHWISLKDFDNFSNFSTDMAEAIARELDLLRGSKAFLPLGTLTEAFLSNLPVFTINEQVFYWNHYLLASIAAHKISEVQVINDEPSPYTVTAMTIPQQVKIQGDVIDYIFQDLRKTHCIFSSADDVFEYLRTHQVRMVKTKKLFARIRDFWGVE